MLFRISTIALLSSSSLLAAETRELGSHEHGLGALNIAIAGSTVLMEFHAPGADIVGFEHPAESAEDRRAIDGAVAALAKPTELFVMPANAECSVVQARASLESEDAHEEHDHAHEEHKDHDGHDDHAEHDTHKDHDDHAENHDHEDAGSHTEFHAEYVLNCANTDALDAIEFVYFKQFENARELEVQIVSAAGANAFEVMRDDPTLDLRGMF